MQLAASFTNVRATIDAAWLGGMLHEVARLALSRSSVGRVAATSRIESSLAPGVERDAPAVDPGAYLTTLWGLPEPIIEAVGCYRNPRCSPEQTPGPLTAVHAAHALLDEADDFAAGDSVALDEAYLHATGCTDRLPAWREICAALRAEGAPS